MAAVCSLSSAAIAQTSPKRQAQELVNRGNQLFLRGDARAALAVYQAAHETFPSPMIFFNIAEAHRKLGDAVAAATAYDRFLAESKVDADDQRSREARRNLDALTKNLATLRLRSEHTDAQVFIDGEPRGRISSLPIRLPPGSRALRVEAPNHTPLQASFHLPAGTVKEVDVALSAQVPNAPPVATVMPVGPSGLPSIPAPASPPAPGRVDLQAPSLVSDGGTDDDDPLVEKWWFWAIVVVGAAAVAGTTVALLPDSGVDRAPTTLDPINTRDLDAP